MNLQAVLETLLKLKEQGRTRAIGVANFPVALLRTAVEEFKAPIACNQVEYHVMLDQTRLRKYLATKAIPLVAYCPLAQGRAAADPTLGAIGRKHGASAAQVALKWLLDQDGVAAIQKASRRKSQRANLDALNIGLDDEDRQAIAALPKTGAASIRQAGPIGIRVPRLKKNGPLSGPSAVGKTSRCLVMTAMIVMAEVATAVITASAMPIAMPA
jgi:diketogulonate reductase-like aldo/keto reductase